MAANSTKRLENAQPKGFQPRPYYGPVEDSLTFNFDNAESYARRVDDLLTLVLFLKTGALVGCQVKGVRENLKRLGDFGLFIKQGEVRLDLFFHLLAFLADNPAQRKAHLEPSDGAGKQRLGLGDAVARS
jgi:hypothetical protein